MNRLATLAISTMLTLGMPGVVPAHADDTHLAAATETGSALSRTPENGCSWVNIEGKWYCI